MDQLPLIGRDAELTRIETRMRSAREGNQRIVAIGGEPGIGKTRFARHVADQARAGPFSVLWARSLEDDWQPQYQIWDDVLSQAFTAIDWSHKGEEVPDWVAPLLPIVPRLGILFPTAPPLGHLSTQEERFRVTDAIVGCLHDLARQQPLLIVLDDLQWADPESLRVLRRLGTAPSSVPLMIVATIRNDFIERSRALADLMNRLRRESTFEEIGLGGLSQAQVARLMRQVGNGEFPPDVVRLITESTLGNPFFVQEMTRHLLEGARDIPGGDIVSVAEVGEFTIPESLRQVVEHRVSRLSNRTQRVLRLAAVCTDGFDFPMLDALTSLDEDELLDSLDEALAARLISPVEPGIERYDFQHQMVRRALYDTWSPSRRVRLHRSLAASLEHLHGGASYLHAGQIATHYHISAQVPGAAAGVPYALGAADQAERRFAPEQAATYYRMARDMAGTLPIVERTAILRSLAVAEANALWLDAALATVDGALDAMREAQASDGEQARFIAAAVTALHDGGAATELWTPLLYQGLALAPPGDEVTWARLTLLIERFEPVTVGVINGSRWLGSDPRATEIARSSGDEELFARSLQPWDLWDREWTEQLSNLIATWHKPGAIIRALTVSGADWLYHHGEFRRARAHFENLLMVSERQGSVPGQAEANVRLGIIHTTLGDLGQARAYEQRATALVERLGRGHRLHASLWWLRALLREVDGGSWADVAAYFISYVSDPNVGRRTIAFDDAALAALALAKSGEAKRARVLLTPLVRILDELEPTLWLLNGTVGFAASAVWELGARDLAPAIYDCAIDVIYAGHDDFPGSSNFLSVARMAILMDRVDEAHSYFEMARAHLEVSGQRPLRAVVDIDEAGVLAEGSFGDRDRALMLATSAHARFVELGMAAWAGPATALADDLLLRQQDPHAIPAGLTQRELDVVRLIARGRSDRQIGDDIFVSPRTVNAHVRNILAKTHLKNRTELSIWALEHGLVRPDSASQGDQHPG